MSKRKPSAPKGPPVDMSELLANLAPPAGPEVAASPPQAILGDPEPLIDETPLVIANLPPDTPTLPGFAMSDDYDELPGDPRIGGLSEAPASGADPAMDRNAREAAPSPVPPNHEVTARPIDVPTDDFITSLRSGLRAGVRYESRIRVLEAYQYPGNLKDAPAWVDRNWTGYASDYDPLRGLEPGPALRVPTRHGDTVVLCRPGDYVVRQEVVLAHGIEPDVVTEVWAKESFEKNFIPEDVRNARYELMSSPQPTSALEPASLSA